MRGELCRSFTLLPRRSNPKIWISKPVKSGIKKFICRGSTSTGALSVKKPAPQNGIFQQPFVGAHD
jgi:hypothetical protein